VWRSDNQGVDWVPISDAIGTSSIGALALTPQNPHTLWCGTGDANGTVDGYDGTGLFVSRDGGITWVYRGLRETSHISSVVVSPGDSNRVFVGAMGKAFTTDANRGLYRSLNGGGTWTRTLFINDSTGVSDIAINPAHPETVYCSTWERVRRLRYRRAFGVDCAVWRSIDGGTTWAKIVNGLPPAGENLGRIAIAVAPTLPSRVYASVTSGAISGYVGLGLFRSDNGGNSWAQVDLGITHRNAFGGFSWYFGLLEVSPVDANDVWTGGTRLLHSIDGGVTLTDVTSTAHVDQHAVWVDPADPNHVFVGNDGGFWWRLGGQWQPSFNLPITQFYAGTVDAGNVNKMLGGAQDNGTSKSEAGPLGWTQVLGGDGFQCLVDPPGTGNILAEWQYCCDKSGLRWSTNNGASYFSSGGWVAQRSLQLEYAVRREPAEHEHADRGQHAGVQERQHRGVLETGERRPHGRRERAGGLQHHLRAGDLGGRLQPVPGRHGRWPCVALAGWRRLMDSDQHRPAEALRHQRVRQPERPASDLRRVLGLRRGPARPARLPQREPRADVGSDLRQPPRRARQRHDRGPAPARDDLCRDRPRRVRHPE
jgi:photosystem II stability/assembly factor-like uncharacterized protein